MNKLPYTHFYLHILVRVVLLSLSIALSMYCVFVLKNEIRSFFSFLLILALIIELLSYLNRSNRNLANFLLGLAHNDFSTSFITEHRGGSYHALYESFHKVNERFQALSAQKEVQHRYLQNLVEHIQTGIVCFDAEGKVIFSNPALSQLLNKPYLSHLEQLKQLDRDLGLEMETIQAGERKLVKVAIETETLQLALLASEFSMQELAYKLVSVQNIQNELEEHEVDAWKKLIRILTHEIMNSISPISSLSDSLYTLSQASSAAPMPRIGEGLNAIRDRSQALLRFTESYRHLTRIPQPHYQRFSLQTILKRIHVLLFPETQPSQVNFSYATETDQDQLFADPDLVEQVLINLCKNAKQALADHLEPRIEVSSTRLIQGEMQVSVIDNGSGIPPELLDQVFVPFFSTREQGSGIGLSLSRQIMLLHKGSLKIYSTLGQGTKCVLTFPSRSVS